jgi:hypothetical protein
MIKFTRKGTRPVKISLDLIYHSSGAHACVMMRNWSTMKISMAAQVRQISLLIQKWQCSNIHNSPAESTNKNASSSAQWEGTRQPPTRKTQNMMQSCGRFLPAPSPQAMAVMRTCQHCSNPPVQTEWLYWGCHHMSQTMLLQQWCRITQDTGPPSLVVCVVRSRGASTAGISVCLSGRSLQLDRLGVSLAWSPMTYGRASKIHTLTGCPKACWALLPTQTIPVYLPSYCYLHNIAQTRALLAKSKFGSWGSFRKFPQKPLSSQIRKTN